MKLCEYMKPRSSGSSCVVPPAANALATNSSTRSRVSQRSEINTSTAWLVSQTAFGVKLRNFSCVPNMTEMWSLTTMQAAVNRSGF